MTEREQSFKTKQEKEASEMKSFADIKYFCDLISVNTTPTEEYCAYDFWMTSGATEAIVEVKVRKEYSSTQIEQWGGPMIEFKKMEGIRQEMQKKGIIDTTVLYFNFFSDCTKIYKLDVNDPTMYSWFPKLLPKDNYNKKEKIWKMVAYLKNPIEIIKN